MGAFIGVYGGRRLLVRAVSTVRSRSDKNINIFSIYYFQITAKIGTV